LSFIENISIRSAHEPLAFNQLARAGLDHPRALSLLRQLMGTALHEGSQTVSIQKHIDCLQLCASADQRVSLYRGEFEAINVNEAFDLFKYFFPGHEWRLDETLQLEMPASQ
jgi:hypothetical protein